MRQHNREFALCVKIQLTFGTKLTFIDNSNYSSEIIKEKIIRLEIYMVEDIYDYTLHFNIIGCGKRTNGRCFPMYYIYNFTL